jgi:hypothetical protein
MAKKLADQFVAIVEACPTKAFKGEWTAGMAKYKQETGKKRPGESRWLGIGRKSTGISDSLDAVNDLQVAFKKQITALKTSDAKRNEKRAIYGHDYVVRDDAGKHLKKLEPAIVLCIKKITDYVTFSIDAFAEEKRSLALEKKTATNNVKKAGSKASQDLKDILRQVEAREHGNKLLAESFQECLGNPLRDMSKQLLSLLHDLESCLEKAWVAHHEAEEASSRGDDSSASSRSSVSSRSSRFTTTTQDQPEDSETEDDQAKEFARRNDALRKNLRSSTKSSRKSTNSKSS